MKGLKKYIISVKHKDGAILSIGAYCDITNDKYFRIYFNGSDTGLRFSKIGNASRHIQKIAGKWINSTTTSGTLADIPKRGTSHNIKMFEYWYMGGEFPKM